MAILRKKNLKQPDLEGRADDWQKILGATPVVGLVDSRSDDEKTAQARLTNATAEELEQNTRWGKLEIGLAYFWRFSLPFVIGFIAGYSACYFN